MTMRPTTQSVTLTTVATATAWLLVVTTSWGTWVEAAVTPSWKSPIDHSSERWLGDESYYDVFPESPEQPQRDARLTDTRTLHDLCPPVPAVLPPGGCDVTECSSDRQCTDQGLKCCYNGCTYTCLPEVKPAPFFDWLREPRRRFQSGLSWLIPGPNEGVNVSPCSTTPPADDAAHLRCPHGYVCSVLVPRDSEKGVPDQGLCVPVRRPGRNRKHRHKNKGKRKHKKKKNKKRKNKEAPPSPGPGEMIAPGLVTSELVHGCDVGEGLKLIQGVTVLMEGRHCLCKDTKLYCDS